MIRILEETTGQAQDGQEAVASEVPVVQEAQLLGVGHQVVEAVDKTYPNLAVNERRQLFRNFFRAICTAVFAQPGLRSSDVATVQSRTAKLLEALGLKVS